MFGQRTAQQCTKEDAAAKSSFDTQSTQITQITANMILLDIACGVRTGSPSDPEQMRSIIGNVATIGAYEMGDALLRKPMSCFVGCACARAASGHIAAALPTNAIKSRRLMASPTRGLNRG